MTAPYVAQDSIPGLLAPAPRKVAPEWFMHGLLGGLSAADYGTTIAGLRKGYSEGNPLMRPFANAGPIPLALAEGGLSALTGWSSHELRKHGSKFWWVPNAIGILGHGYAVQHNLKAMRR